MIKYEITLQGSSLEIIYQMLKADVAGSREIVEIKIKKILKPKNSILYKVMVALNGDIMSTSKELSRAIRAIQGLPPSTSSAIPLQSNEDFIHEQGESINNIYSEKDGEES